MTGGKGGASAPPASLTLRYSVDEARVLATALNLTREMIDVGWTGIVTGDPPDRRVVESLKLRVLEALFDAQKQPTRHAALLDAQKQPMTHDPVTGKPFTTPETPWCTCGAKTPQPAGHKSDCPRGRMA